MNQIGFEASENRTDRRVVWAIFILAAIAILFNIAYLGGDFYLDDFLLLNGFESGDSFNRWQGVWGVDSPRVFERLWWKSDEFDISFWRPVPSLVWEASLAWFGHEPLPLHLFYVLVHAGVVVGLFELVRRLSGKTGLAFLAALFFVACEDNAMPLSWISACTDVIGTLFMVLALITHAGWLRKRRASGRSATILFVILALGCKESAVVLPPVLLLMTWLMPQGGDTEIGKKSVVGKPPAFWLPEVLVLVVYLVLYKIQGFGAAGSLGYIDPLATPGAYLGHMIVHLPVFWMAAFSVLPPFLTFFIPDLLPIAAVIGAILFALVVTALWPARRRGLIVWALLTFLLGLAPQLSTDASERGLYFPMIAGAILLAALASNVGPLYRRLGSLVPRRPRRTRLTGWLVVLTVLIPGLFFSAARPWVMHEAMAVPEDELKTVLPYVDAAPSSQTFLLNTSGFMNTFYCHDIIDYRSEEEVDVWPLSAAQGRFTMERTGESSLVIRTDRPGWLDNAFARIVRHEPRFTVGQKVLTRVFAATVLEVTPEATDVLAVRFEFQHSLEDPSYLFLYWNGEAFAPVEFASMAIGAVRELADTSDLARAMNL